MSRERMVNDKETAKNTVRATGGVVSFSLNAFVYTEVFSRFPPR
jgi:hypothetical protein